MPPTDGREIVYAGAGLLWGVITVFRGFQVWREEQKRVQVKFPSVILAGAAIFLVCTAYLIWNFVL